MNKLRHGDFVIRDRGGKWSGCYNKYLFRGLPMGKAIKYVRTVEEE